jgi:hypothetical protein
MTNTAKDPRGARAAGLPVYLLPLGLSLVLVGVSLLLPAGDFFDFLRGLFVGLLAAIVLGTVVTLVSLRRRRSWRAQAKLLDDLEPLGHGAPPRSGGRASDADSAPRP